MYFKDVYIVYSFESDKQYLPPEQGSLVAQLVNNLHAMQETPVPFQSLEDPLEKGSATHSSILAWQIPWTEEPDRLQSVELQRVRHN